MKFSLEIIYGHGKSEEYRIERGKIGSGIECKGFILSPSPLALSPGGGGGDSYKEDLN